MESGVSNRAGPGLVIPPEVATRVNNALADGKPIVVGYVTATAALCWLAKQAARTRD